MINKIFKKVKWFFVKTFFKRKSWIYQILYNDMIDIKLYKKNSKKGKNTKLYSPFRATNSEIGDYTYIAENSILGNTKVGKFCSIGPNLISGWGLHPLHGISTHPMFYSTQKQNGMTLCDSDKFQEIKPIEIGNDVYIGMNVTILDGVNIGHGAVIGAGAVVSKDIPPYAIAVGCPIKIKGYRFDEETIQKLLKMKWWNFDERQLQQVEMNFFDVDKWLKNKETKN